MTDIRKGVDEVIDRMTDSQVARLKKFLAAFPPPLAAACRNVPESDEPETEDEARLAAEAKEWLKQNGGKGVPHEEIKREFRLE